ncbi:MAG: AAA family ATPase, partial [Clostridiales bacterium]
MKTALILNMINPSLGGVLIRGEKGTAKSTAVRGIAALLEKTEKVKGCVYNCDPNKEIYLCDDCLEKLAKGKLPRELRKKKVIELPVSATEDRVIGTLNIETAIKKGEKEFEPGILAAANNNILYVDEVNLLDDHVVDVLLDSAAMGVNTIEREGVSFSHPARFVLIGTMNPEEGDLRPQLLDRFGLVVEISGEKDPQARKEVVKRRLAFEADPDAFIKIYEDEGNKIKDRITEAAKLLENVEVPEIIYDIVAELGIKLGVDGHRA